MSRKLPAPSAVNQFEHLVQQASGDAQDFVCLRRAMIAELIERPDVNSCKLSTLQDEIDRRRAQVLAPQQIIDVVTQLLHERITELQKLSEQLTHLLPGDHSRKITPT